METSASLLERLRTSPDEAAWRRLADLYQPLIRRWLLRDPSLREEADDIVQEVMNVLVRELPAFRRRRNGSFRRWLHTITANRVAALYRSRKNRPVVLGRPVEESSLTQLADPNSELNRQWDREHERRLDRQVTRPQHIASGGQGPDRLTTHFSERFGHPAHFLI